MNRRGVHDVAIVGAGMVGAALALRLARDGFDVALVDSREPPAWNAADELDLRVVALAPSSIDFLKRIDVWTAMVDARVSPFRRMQVWDASAPGSLGFDAAERGEASLGAIVENRLIQSMLWDAARRAPLDVRVPANVVTMDMAASRRVLSFDDGTSLSAQLVVAADGAESALRRMVGIETVDRDYAQRAIVAHVRTSRPHESTAWQRFLPGATLAFLPLADGRSSIVWSVPADEAARLLALDDAAFCRELGAAFDFRLGEITAVTARAAVPLRMRLARTYVAPRFVLAGDAAHVVHPLAGQGVNLGLRDAMELADILVDAKACGRAFAADHVLRRYDRRRRSDDTLSAHAFDAIQRVFGSGSPVLATLRGAGLALVDRIGPLKRAFARHAAGR